MLPGNLAILVLNYLSWEHTDPESYAVGSVQTDRACLGGQVKGYVFDVITSIKSMESVGCIY
jgi:hypothetical protein